MYVRWQHRTKSTRRGPVGLTTATRLPTAGDLALDAAVVAVAPRRWRRPKPPKPATLIAIVVESKRIDGRPRQSLVAYLGCIRVADLDLPSARRKFWTRADVGLEQFAPEDRGRFEAALAARVPRPPAEPRRPVTMTEAIAAARARMQALKTAQAS